jgi:hypothetical protein
MLILNPLEKLQNIQAKKFIDLKVMGKRSLFLCTKVFHNLFGKIFLHFFNRTRNAQKTQKVFLKILV